VTDALRVVLADDQVLLRQGIARLLGDAGFEVVAEAGDAPDLLRKVRAHRPDIAIVDVQMPPDKTDDGLRAAIAIRQALPDVGVLVLSQFVEQRYAVDLIGASAERVGYLLKDRVADFSDFADAVRRVAAGGSALDPAVVAEMLGRRRRDDPLADLTPRERDVLELMAQGLSNRGIADVLVVTPHAVEKHVSGIFSKLGVGEQPEDHRRVQAVLTFLRGRGEPSQT
jgi:DNA-binding NarL/FixJ family response regulator